MHFNSTILQAYKQREYKGLMTVISGLLLIVLMIIIPAQADKKLNQPEKAKEIAQEMIDRDDGRTRYSRAELLTCRYDMKGGKRKCVSRPVRKSVESVSIDTGTNSEDTTTLVIILDPPSERNMAFLQKDYNEEGKDSDQWMYFPALKKHKRIVSQSDNSPKTGSIFGTEISYEDAEKMHISDYVYSYNGEDRIDNRDAEIITAYPVEKHAGKTSYSKEKFWVDKVTRIPLKREAYDKRGRLVKTFFRKDINQKNGVWLNRIMIVVNHETGRMTMEKILRTAVNIPVDDSLVNMRSLKDASFREAKLRSIREMAD